MSTQRMIKDSFWTDTYISNLDPIEKLLFIFLLTNPLCNIAGIYEIQIRRIAFDTGIDRDMVEKLLQRLEIDEKILRIDDWIVIINFARHQSYKNPNVTKGIKRIIEELPKKVKALKGFERLSHLTLLNLTLPNVNERDKSLTESTMWKKQSEDEVEVSIDFDSGEEIKPKEKPKRHYKEVYTIFEEVLGKLPTNWFVNTTQQKCAENLFTERGLKAIKNALEFYKVNKDEEFCPLITQPSDLDSKWTKLAEYKKRSS
jgi:hypothetical protein